MTGDTVCHENFLPYGNGVCVAGVRIGQAGEFIRCFDVHMVHLAHARARRRPILTPSELKAQSNIEKLNRFVVVTDV